METLENFKWLILLIGGIAIILLVIAYIKRDSKKNKDIPYEKMKTNEFLILLRWAYRNENKEYLKNLPYSKEHVCKYEGDRLHIMYKKENNEYEAHQIKYKDYE